ncbi:DUF421 domain-containing protein [Metabacillus sp. FJAT-52054]|uniref:DUF421 domain-containing protein n=1 Tax=Metabacillus sediminis TaxID=3117746 RepID=A0ABZ2NGG7_9BACI
MDVLYRSIIIFLAGYFVLRVTGKKAVAQMHSFDLLYILILGNIISQPLQKDHVWMAVLYTILLAIFYKIFMRLSLHNKLRWILYESPTVLIRNGEIDRKGLKKVRMPIDELLAQLRIKGFTETKNIAIALMEDSGEISVIPKADYRPVNPKDLKLNVSHEFIPIPLIMDGQVLDHNLKYLQHNREWLDKKISHKGGAIENVLLATYQSDGNLHIDTKSSKEHKHDPFYYQPGEDN